MNEWHSMSIEEIQNALNIPSQNGITVAEARKRLENEKKQSGGRFSLFVKKKKHLQKTFFSLLFSPLMLMLVVTAILSLVFGGFLPGLCVLFISLSVIGISGALLISSQNHLDKVNQYSSPMVKVKRDGRIYHTDGRNAVCGDIVSFSKGDIIVADVRLISTDNLIVKELYNTRNGIRNRMVQKDSALVYAPDEIHAPDAQNMVYAGSAVIEGDGIGIVVDTDRDVYLAKYANEGSLDVQKSDSSEIKKISPFIRISYIVAILVICALSLVSLLTMRETPFIANFLLLLSSLFTVSIEVVSLIYQRHTSFSSSVLFNSYSAESDSAACVRGCNTLEALSGISDVILLGDAAFSSGEFQVSEVYSAGERFDQLSPSNILGSRILGCIDSYIRAQRESGISDEISKEGISDSLLRFLRASEFDFGASLLTTVSLYYLPDKPGKTGHACVETNKGEYRVSLTLDREILSHCSCVRTPDGMDREMYRFFSEGIDAFLNDNSKKYVFVVTEYAGEAVLEAIVALSPVNSNEIVPSIDALKKLGIKTRILSLDERSIECYTQDLFDKLCGKKVAFASEFKSEGKEITDDLEEYCAYFGFTSDEYTSLLAKMRSQGARIATYGVNDDYYDVMAESDVSISCDVINYSSNNHSESVYERIRPDGRESSLRTSQRMRLLSNIIIRRTHKRGGGLSSIVNALVSAKSIMPKVALSVLFICIVLSLTVPFTLMSIVTGVPLVNAPNVMLMISYALIMSFLVFPNCSIKQGCMIPRGNNNESLIICYLKRNIGQFIAHAALSVTISIFVVILELVGVFGNASGYTFAIHFGMLFVLGFDTLFFMNKYFEKISASSKIKTAILFVSTYLLSILTIVAAIFDSTSFGGISTLEFLISPIFIILYFIAKFVLSVAQKIGNKEKN